MEPVKQQQIIETNINANFDNEINLHRLIGNKNAVEILQTIVDQYYADKSEGRTPSYPTIIIKGKENSGKRTMALALNNTLCNTFNETLGQTLSMGGDDIYEYFKKSDENTTHFINQGDKLTSFSQNVIYKIHRDKMLYVVNPFERSIVEHPYGGGIIIMSVDSASKKSLINPLLDVIEIHLNLKDKYSSIELFDILKQRIKLLGWLCSDKIIENIAYVSKGNVGKAIRILSFTYRVMRSKNEDNITSIHLNKCLHLLSSNYPDMAKK